MGEKGNAVAAVGSELTGAATGTLIERTTVTATTAVTDLGEDLVGTIREKSIGAVADNTVGAARDKLQREDPNGSSADSPTT